MDPSREELLAEIEKWKGLYYQELNKTKQLERELGQRQNGRPQEKPQQKRSQHQRPAPRQHEGRQQAPPQAAPPEDTDREAVKNKLRLACSQNDRAMLQQTIREAERLGMPEVEYAKRKLNSLL